MPPHGSLPRRLLLCALVLLPAVAHAGPVKGTVTFPDGPKGRRLVGFWRIENSHVPVQPAAGKPEAAVVVEGPKGAPPAPKTYTVELSGLEASHRILVVGVGSVVEFKNSDRVPHELGIPDQGTYMPVERLPAGQVRKQKFGAPGPYVVRDAEFPHILISVIVVETPFFALLDEHGGFSVPGVPDGKATLKVFSGGKWVAEQAIEVGAKSGDLAIKAGGGASGTAEGGQ